MISTLFLSSAFFCGRVFVYDTNVAHPGLTRQAAELYNKSIAGTAHRASLPNLTDQEIAWLTRGAIEEDTPLRWMNHFYDPVHNVGFKGAYDTAKTWAVDVKEQTSFSKGNQTWQEAIYQYQKGDKEQAYVALGHVLHLLEDMTVPAHTRDDGHPFSDPYEVWTRENFKEILSQPIFYDALDKYFDYLANYSNNNFYSNDTIESKEFKIINLDGLDSQIGLDGKLRNYAFSDFEQKHYLYWIDSQFDWSKFLYQKGDEKKNNDPFILSNNFSLLAPKAVGAGAGAIKLFFEETQKEHDYTPPFWRINPLGILQEGAAESVMEAGNIFGDVKDQLGNLWQSTKNLVTRFGDKTTSVEFLTELWKTQSALAADIRELGEVRNIITQTPLRIVQETGRRVAEAAQSEPAPVVYSDSDYAGGGYFNQPRKKSANNNRGNEGEENSNSEDLISGFLSSPIPASPSSVVRPEGEGAPSSGSSNSGSFLPNSGGVSQTAGAGGSSYSSSGGGAAFTSSPNNSFPPADSPSPLPLAGGEETAPALPLLNPPSPPPDATSPDAPIIFDPAVSPFFTTGASYTILAAISLDTYKINFNNQEIISSSTIFSQTAELTEGENIFDLTAEDLAGNKSATSTVKIVKDTIGPKTAVISTINSRQLTINWSGEDKGIGLESFDVEYQRNEIGGGAVTSTVWNVLLSAATSTQAEFIGEEGFEYIFRARARDRLGNYGEWAEAAAQRIELPRVVINEIAWGGTGAATSDEWLELYNVSEDAVDLTGWTLTDGNDIKINFSSSSVLSIPVRGFYLLERTNDQTISNIAADYIYKGSLKDSGEKLQLRNSQGKIIDEVDGSAKWFAGRNEYDRETMERKDPLASGNLSDNWQGTPLAVWHGFDAKGGPIAGTPKSVNSPFVYLNGVLDRSRVLTSDLNPYFLGNLTVASGTVLTIGPGVTILGAVNSNFFIYGEIRAKGETGQPVVFSAYGDPDYQKDYYFHDNFWGFLRAYPGSILNFKNASFIYGNSNIDAARPQGLIYAEETSVDFEKVVMDKNMEAGARPLVQLVNSQSIIKDSDFFRNKKGLVIKGGSAEIKGNTFQELGFSALEAEDVKSLNLENNVFKDNGWIYTTVEPWNAPNPLISPISVKGYLPTAKDNDFDHNIVNALEYLGQVKASGTIDNAGDNPWVIGDLFIPAETEVEITAGSILKMVEWSLVTVNGVLKASGEESKEIIFTSIHDDSDGFELDLTDGRSPNKEGNEWKQVVLNSPSTSTLNYLRIRYANTSADGSLIVKNTPLEADHLTIEYSRVPGIALSLQNADKAILKSLYLKNDGKWPFNPFSNSNGTGLLIDGGSPVIDSAIIDTFNYGLRIQNFPAPVLNNIQFANVDF